MKRKDPSFNTQQLGNLLERYKRIFTPPQASVEKVAIEVIKKITQFELLPTQIHYNVGNRNLILTVPSLFRSEIKLKQSDILIELEKRLGSKNTPRNIL
jgi:hypothetical protein